MLFIRTKPEQPADAERPAAADTPAKRALWARLRRAKHDAVDAEASPVVADVVAEVPVIEKPAHGLFARWAARFRRPTPRQDTDTAASATSNACVADPEASGPLDDGRAAAAVDVKEKQKPSAWARLLRRRAADPTEQRLPIRLLVGFLPEVTERDAREFARGIAEKYCENLSIAYVDVAQYGTGWAYEVQEGGSGRAYLPAVLQYFKAQGEHEPGKSVSVIVRTATRLVKIERTRDGLSATQLPETAQEDASDWVKPTLKMSPVISTMLPVLVLGGTFAGTGALAFGIANLGRIQPYMPPPAPRTERVDLSLMPHAQWPRLTNLQPGDYVVALTYENGRWQIRTHLSRSQQPGVPAAPLPEPPTR